MTLKERIAKLTEARALVEQVRDSLTTESRTCACCGLKAYANFDQHQVREHLNAALTKLDKSMAWMVNEPGKFA